MPAVASFPLLGKGFLPHTVSRELFFHINNLRTILRTLSEGVRQCVTESNPPPPALLVRKESE